MLLKHYLKMILVSQFRRRKLQKEKINSKDNYVSM